MGTVPTGSARAGFRESEVFTVPAFGGLRAPGYSRETSPNDHAEELALRRAIGTELASATLYSSLEPCLHRKSRPTPCSKLISAAGVRRVVIAWREPPLFVQGGGAIWLAPHALPLLYS